MASINKVIIIGNLGGDPEVRFTPGGQAVANFNVATNERWTNKQTSKPEERTEWHRVVVWGKLAELCKEYLAKGRNVYVEGRLQTRKWEDKQGQPKYTTEIVAQTIQFLGGPGGAKSSERSYGSSEHSSQDQHSQEQHSMPDSSSGPPPFDDDVPF